MRELKFRAWDKSRKRFYGGEVGLMPNHQINRYARSRDWGTLIVRPSNNDLYEVGQYTGLKDKNGKEIYEGDIVEVDTSHDDEGLYPTTYKDEVRFQMGAFYPVSEMPTDRTMVVIGNIHEDKELLK